MLIQDNLMSGGWSNEGVGSATAVLLRPTDQDGSNPNVPVRNAPVQNNRIENVFGGIRPSTENAGPMEQIGVASARRFLSNVEIETHGLVVGKYGVSQRNLADWQVS